MRELALIQVGYEKETWQRLVCFMTEENILLKKRLAEVLKDQFNYSLLERLECFQTRFIKADNLVNLLRHDLAELDHLLETTPVEDGNFVNLHTTLLTLRNIVRNAEREFIRLKSDFNSYLAENV